MGLKTRTAAKIFAAVLTVAGPFIATWEGFSPVVYNDIVGVATVCYGHTGPGVVYNRVYSKEMCKDLLSQDAEVAFRFVYDSVPDELSTNVYAAFTSFTLNVGRGNFKNSTALKLLKQGRIVEACHELPKWIYAGGKKVKGLVNRRKAEMELCLG